MEDVEGAKREVVLYKNGEIVGKTRPKKTFTRKKIVED